jgi:hypothetical protein
MQGKIERNAYTTIVRTHEEMRASARSTHKRNNISKWILHELDLRMCPAFISLDMVSYGHSIGSLSSIEVKLRKK